SAFPGSQRGGATFTQRPGFEHRILNVEHRIVAIPELIMPLPSNESNLFSPLPQWKTPWSEFVWSYGIQAVVITILVWIPVLHPEIMEGPKKDYHAIELVPTPVPVDHTPQRQLPKPV